MGCIVALGVCGAPSGNAGPAAGEAAAEVRAGHFSPDAPALDIYLTNVEHDSQTLFLPNVEYGDVSAYLRIPPGRYSVGLRLAGSDPSVPAAMSCTLDATAGDAFTACAVGSLSTGNLATVVVSDNNTATNDTAIPPARTDNYAEWLVVTALTGAALAFMIARSIVHTVKSAVHLE